MDCHYKIQNHDTSSHHHSERCADRSGIGGTERLVGPEWRYVVLRPINNDVCPCPLGFIVNKTTVSPSYVDLATRATSEVVERSVLKKTKQLTKCVSGKPVWGYSGANCIIKEMASDRENTSTTEG